MLFSSYENWYVANKLHLSGNLRIPSEKKTKNAKMQKMQKMQKNEKKNKKLPKNCQTTVF